MYNISILTIGDEVCIGQIVNTNAAWISERCSEIGAYVSGHIAVHDDANQIIDALDRLLSFSDYIIITGGLGPTEDDITKEVLCNYFDDELKLHQGTLDYLKKFYELRNREFSKINYSLAHLPQKCKILANKVGTAPGMLFKKNTTSIVSLPGVPTEMKYLMNSYVLHDIARYIDESGGDKPFYKTIITLGIPESDLAEKIGSLKEIFNGYIAYLPSYSGVRIRLNVIANNLDLANTEFEKAIYYIKSRVGKYIISFHNHVLNKIINNELMILNRTVAVAESCTGGLLGALFTDTPGSSQFFLGGIVAYSNDIKIDILGVNKRTIIEHGAVSKKTAEEMAKNVRKKFNSDFGISITGIAGPDGGSNEKPVGTVWIGISDKSSTTAIKYLFGNGRTKNRELAVSSAVYQLLERLRS